MTRFLQGLLVLPIAYVGAAAEASETYFCSFTPLSKSAWVPPQVAMRLSDNRKSAQVWAIEETPPIAVEMAQRSDISYLLDWTASSHTMVAEKSDGGRNLIADGEESQDRYRVILNVENMKVSLQVLSDATSDAQSSRGAGTCVLTNAVVN